MLFESLYIKNQTQLANKKVIKIRKISEVFQKSPTVEFMKNRCLENSALSSSQALHSHFHGPLATQKKSQVKRNVIL